MYVRKSKMKEWMRKKEEDLRIVIENEFNERINNLRAGHRRRVDTIERIHTKELDRVYREMKDYRKAYELFREDKEFFKFFKERMSPQIISYMEQLGSVMGHFNSGEAKVFLSENKESKVVSLMSESDVEPESVDDLTEVDQYDSEGVAYKG